MSRARAKPTVTSTAIVTYAAALPSLDQARAILASKETIREVRHIEALAQAVKSRAASEDARNHAAALVLLCQARIGELTQRITAEPAHVTGARGGRGRKAVPGGNTLSRSARLEAEGLTRKDASECEAIARLDERGELVRYIGVHASGGELPSKAAALALDKLPADVRETTLAKLREEPDAIAEAQRRLRREARLAKCLDAARGNAPLSAIGRLYPVIYADPPWRYEQSMDTRAVENHYPTMTLDAICALPVASIATDDAVLFLWATSPKLAEAMRVVEAWGFAYRTKATWVKDSIGMGFWFRQRDETLLVAVRGDMPTPEKPHDSVIEAPRGKHSKKPAIFYEVIESYYPTLPKIELFARGTPRPGWAAWGNEVNHATE